MPYSAEISRVNPGCVLFAIDQSGSMSDRMESGTKADVVASSLNRVLQDLIIRCSKEEVWDYFDVGVIGYGANGAENALHGVLGKQLLNPISAIANNPVRVEDRVRKISDGAGGLVEVEQKFPVWFEPVADNGTPMVAALSMAGQALADWCDSHQNSYPPVIIHLTDGESGDGDPEAVAGTVRQISTSDGNVLIMNCHVSSVSSREIVFPSLEEGLPDNFARMLFRMSSRLPNEMQDVALSYGLSVTGASRAFMFNAKTEQIVQFFEIGTRASNLR